MHIYRPLAKVLVEGNAITYNLSVCLQVTQDLSVDCSQVVGEL